MHSENRYRNDRLITSLAAGVAAVVAWVSQLNGPLEGLGIKTTLSRIGAVAIVAVLVYLWRLQGRRSLVESLRAIDPCPLGTVSREVLGDVKSELAESSSRDGVVRYVRRNHDTELSKKLSQDQVVILVGPTGSGKSASAREVVTSALPNARTIIPRRPARVGDRTVTNILTLMGRERWRRGSAVLWLDDLGFYLERDPIDIAALRRWLGASRDRRLVATMSARDRNSLIQSQSASGESTRELLGMASPQHLAINWGGGELKEALYEYPKARTGCLFLSRYLSSGDVHLRRFRDSVEACPEACAILRAAVHWRRAGLVRAIPETFLRYAFSVYFDGSSAGRDADEIFETGLTWATDPCDAHRAVLEQASESGEAFIIAEVAVEEAFERSEQYSEAAWQQLLGEVKGTPDEAVVAKAAAGQGFTALSFRAIQDMLQPKAVASDAQASAQAVWNESLRREQARFPAAPERDRSRPPTIPDRPLSQPRSFMLAALYRRTALWAGLRTTALLTSDILGVWAAVLGAYCITEKRVDFWRAQESTDQRIAYASLLVVVLFSVVGLYRRRSRRGNAPRVIAALTQGMIGVLALRSLIGLSIGSYALLGWAYLFSCVTVTSLRGSLTELGVWAANRARGRKMHSALVGTRAQVEPVAAVMANDERAGEILGYIGPLEGEPDQGRLRHLGEGRTELGWLRLMTMHDIDELVLCDPIASEDFAGMLAGIAGRTGVKLKAVAPTRDFLVAVSRYTPGEPLPLEELRRPQFERPEYAVKRAFDVSVSATLLVVLLVPAIIVAGVIKVTSRRGRVIEKIPYPGPNNSIFWLYKFRIAHLSDAGIPLSKPTFAGRLIQAVGFDEVPQLLNVLRGNMSLVGPRPISQRDYSRLPDWQQARNEVLPGITGLWQISGRHDSTFGAMMSLDLYYVQRWSLFLDVEILLKTIGAALRNRRAELEVPVEPARRPRRISEKRAAFGPSLLAALPRHGGITFEEALEIAVASGGEAREVLRWLTRVERNGWLDISPTDAGHTFALSELGALRSAEDRRRRVSY